MAAAPESLDLDAETRIPASWVSAALCVIGLATVMAANSDPEVHAATELITLSLGLAILAIAVIVPSLEARGQPRGRWLMVLVLIVLIFWLGVWRGGAFLAFLAVPTALAAALLSPTAAVITAIGASGLVVWGPSLIGMTSDPTTTSIALMVMLAVPSIIIASSLPERDLARQSWQYYTQARDWLEDARNRKVELEQTLVDLEDANRQLTRLNIMARDLRQAAEEARAAKAQFVANVSHELRTPLNMIIGFSELILQAPKTYGRRIPTALLADLVVIKRNAEHLADLVDDVLDLSQVESEQVALAKEYVSLHEVVSRAVTSVRPLFDSKNLFLQVDVPEDLSPVFCDATRIREVMLNLLSNAGRFTEKGGVHLRAWQDGQDVTVAITDTGPGISIEDMRKLFQPFQQLDSSIRRRYGGTGLGLNISKRFIELHNGKIWVESTVGAGTTFFFRLPLGPAVMATESSPHWLIRPEWEYRQRTRPSSAPVAKVLPRFIVLDPSNALTRLLSRYMHNVDVVPVTTLEKALMEAQVPSQALLVNGHTVSQSLETIYASLDLPESLPVIICSVPGMAEASAALGASDYLVKPISMDVLLQSLERMNVRRGTVLIVDDEPDAQQLFRRILLSSGRDYRVLIAQDGQEAIHMCHEYSPDVLLLDLVLPNMDGFQVLRIRQEDPVLRAIPVILISARDPAGQPIVSDAVAITRKGGLSARQLLETIRFLSGIPVQPDQPVGPKLPGDQPG